MTVDKLENKLQASLLSNKTQEEVMQFMRSQQDRIHELEALTEQMKEGISGLYDSFVVKKVDDYEPVT